MTELDLARLGVQPTVFTRVYAGGHMTYLDDASRPRLKADIAAFVQGAAVAQHADAQPRAVGSAIRAGTIETRMHANASDAPARPGIAPGAQALPVDRSALPQGGDSWLPPAMRTRPSASSPHGAALAARVQAKIAERNRDFYR